LTKDSICKDCVSRKYFIWYCLDQDIYQGPQERISCKKWVDGGLHDPLVKVLECSEYEKLQKTPCSPKKSLS